MAYFDSLVSGAVGVTHPQLKPLVEKLGEFHRQFFVVDAHLRCLGLGYLVVADRWYDYFAAALGPQSGETTTETQAVIAALDVEIAKLDSILASAVGRRDAIIPALPEKERERLRARQLITCVAYAAKLRAFIDERRQAVASKYPAA